MSDDSTGQQLEIPFGMSCGVSCAPMGTPLEKRLEKSLGCQTARSANTRVPRAGRNTETGVKFALGGSLSLIPSRFLAGHPRGREEEDQVGQRTDKPRAGKPQIRNVVGFTGALSIDDRNYAKTRRSSGPRVTSP